MTNPDEQGLSPLQELGYYAQALRRESPEWRSMSMSERRDEILTLVVEAADGRYVKEPEVQAKAIAELVIKERDQWPYWVHISKEKSQKGWFAWHVVLRDGATSIGGRPRAVDQAAAQRMDGPLL